MNVDMAERSKCLMLGLPKGRFLPNTQQLLRGLGIDFNRGSRALSFTTTYLETTIIVKIMKMADIAYLLKMNLLDVGVLCDEWAYEHGLSKLNHDKLNWCQSTFALAAPMAFKNRSMKDIKRVVSAYPNLARHLLREVAPEASILQLSGSAESAVPELADAIVDCVETGATLKANNLKPVKWLARTNVHVYKSNETEFAHAQDIADLIQSLSSLSKSPVDLNHSTMVADLL